MTFLRLLPAATFKAVPGIYSLRVVLPDGAIVDVNLWGDDPAIRAGYSPEAVLIRPGSELREVPPRAELLAIRPRLLSSVLNAAIEAHNAALAP